MSRLRNKINFLKLRSKYKRKHVYINNSSYVDNDTFFEGYNTVHERSLVLKSHVGLGTYIHNNSKICKTKIGRWCSIAPNVSIVSGNHPTKTIISTHPIFYSNRSFAGLSFLKTPIFEEYSYTDGDRTWLCEIGNDVWICENAKIINGVKIGDGAIVAAGAIVTKDVPPYAIVAGVPAKIIRYRFNESEIKYIKNSKWWERDIQWLKQNAKSFKDINDFQKIQGK